MPSGDRFYRNDDIIFRVPAAGKRGRDILNAILAVNASILTAREGLSLGRWSGRKAVYGRRIGMELSRSNGPFAIVVEFYHPQ
jgi:hypothetical protein